MSSLVSVLGSYLISSLGLWESVCFLNGEGICNRPCLQTREQMPVSQWRTHYREVGRGSQTRHSQQSAVRGCGEARCVPTSGPSLRIVVSEEEYFFLNISCVVLSLCLGSFLMYSEKETSSKVFTSENSRTENSSQGPFP